MAKTNELIKQDDIPEKRPISLSETGIQLRTYDDLWRFSNNVVRSGLAPKDMDRPETIMIAVEMGLEVGLKPMQALQNIAVINGRPAIWGDAVPGLCRGSGLCEYIKVDEVGKPYEKDYGYRVTTKRAGDDNIYTYTFTVDDAERAGLWNKSGPWKQYPKRMLMNRARTFALRDAFPDVLKGISTTEEENDIRVPEYEVVNDGKTHTERLADKAAAIAEAVNATINETSNTVTDNNTQSEQSSNDVIDRQDDFHEEEENYQYDNSMPNDGSDTADMFGGK